MSAPRKIRKISMSPIAPPPLFGLSKDTVSIFAYNFNIHVIEEKFV